MTQGLALLLSLVVEVPVLVAVVRARDWSDAPLGRLLLVGTAATLLTHPFVWHGTPAMEPWIGSWWARAAIAEVAACIVEAAVFRGLLVPHSGRALLLSLGANALSFGVGLVWFLWLGPQLQCPRGLDRDRDRVEALGVLVGHPVTARVCFGVVSDRGVRDSEGRFLLDRSTEDRLLAARVVHLELHVAPDGQGDDCLRRLRREEASGWVAELEHRRALRVSDPTCPVEAALGPTPSAGDVEEWVVGASDPVAARLRESHRRRCGLL